MLGGDIPSKPSVIVSGRSMRIAHADATICSAPEFIHISHAKNIDFLASPNRDISHEEACKFRDKAIPPLAMPLPTNVPSTLFTGRQACDAESNAARQLVTVEKNGIEYVLRLGSKIADEKESRYRHGAIGRFHLSRKESYCFPMVRAILAHASEFQASKWIASRRRSPSHATTFVGNVRAAVEFCEWATANRSRHLSRRLAISDLIVLTLSVAFTMASIAPI